MNSLKHNADQHSSQYGSQAETKIFDGKQQEQSIENYYQIPKPLLIQQIVSFTPHQQDIIEQTPNFNSMRKQNSFTSQAKMAHSDLGISKQRNSAGRRKKMLLNFEIKIGEQQYAFLKFYENDDSYRVATEFCSQYGLPMETVPVIEQSIQSNLEKLYRSKKSAKREKNKQLTKDDGNLKEKLSSGPLNQSVLVINLEVEGKPHEIRYYMNQDPEIVAEEFRYKNRLSREAKVYIQEIIEQNLTSYKENLKQQKLHEIEPRSNHLFASQGQTDDSTKSESNNLKRDAFQSDRNSYSKELTATNERNSLLKGELSEVLSMVPNNKKETEFGRTTQQNTNKDELNGKSTEDKDNLLQESYEKWHNIIKQKNFQKDQTLEGIKLNFMIYLTPYLCLRPKSTHKATKD